MHKIKLNDIDTRAPHDIDKQATKRALAGILKELDELQNLLFAESKRSLLVVIQGMDASGKDGVVRNVFTSMNPAGVDITSFKVPTKEEDAHDFLWRVHPHAPAKGMIQAFNRSYYESVLITRVHKMIDDKTAQNRMRSINDFERLLTEDNNTHILKFYLHISHDEQLDRLKDRTTKPQKMWKYNPNDMNESELWSDYRKCYEDVFEHCNVIPWHIIPSDQNWYKSYLVAKTLLQTLKGMKMKYPKMNK